jgi:hypothetical protein
LTCGNTCTESAPGTPKKHRRGAQSRMTLALDASLSSGFAGILH